MFTLIFCTAFPNFLTGYKSMQVEFLKLVLSLTLIYPCSLRVYTDSAKQSYPFGNFLYRTQNDFALYSLDYCPGFRCSLV